MTIEHQLFKESVKNQILITFDYKYEQWSSITLTKKKAR
jgi:hypothetical protein